VGEKKKKFKKKTSSHLLGKRERPIPQQQCRETLLYIRGVRGEGFQKRKRGTSLRGKVHILRKKRKDGFGQELESRSLVIVRRKEREAEKVLKASREGKNTPQSSSRRERGATKVETRKERGPGRSGEEKISNRRHQKDQR